MASTSNVTSGVDAEPDNSTFDLDLGLTTDTALRRDVHQLYHHLVDVECKSPSSPKSVDGYGLYRTPEFGGWVLGGQEDDACRVPMQLLQEGDDLLLIYLRAKVQENCIRAAHYMVVVKLLLVELTMSDKRIREVRHPQAFAPLLLRLSRELISVPRGGLVSPCLSDPADYYGCLGELLEDMEETFNKDDGILKECEEKWGPDGHVYVSRGTDSYTRRLELAAAELNSCWGA